MSNPLKNPVSIALEGDDILVYFERDDRVVRIRDLPQGWQKLRSILVAREIASHAPTIGMKGSPLQHTVDVNALNKALDQEILDARATLKSLGIKL